MIKKFFEPLSKRTIILIILAVVLESYFKLSLLSIEFWIYVLGVGIISRIINKRKTKDYTVKRK
jgi:hypothetical protein